MIYSKHGFNSRSLVCARYMSRVAVSNEGQPADPHGNESKAAQRLGCVERERERGVVIARERERERERCVMIAREREHDCTP